jgi:hypothetical protein
MYVIRGPGWSCLSICLSTNKLLAWSSSYIHTPLVPSKLKSASVANVCKSFWTQQASEYNTGSHFRPSLIFEGNVGSQGDEHLRGSSCRYFRIMDGDKHTFQSQIFSCTVKKCFSNSSPFAPKSQRHRLFPKDERKGFISSLKNHFVHLRLRRTTR